MFNKICSKKWSVLYGMKVNPRAQNMLTDCQTDGAAAVAVANLPVVDGHITPPDNMKPQNFQLLVRLSEI